MPVKKREKICRVLLTTQEQRDLKAAAERAGMPLAVYVRHAALALARGEAKPAGTK
jgi:hypothetical protein